MPSLLKIAGVAQVDRAALAEMGKTIAEALETAEVAGWRVDGLLGRAKEESLVAEDEADDGKDAADGLGAEGIIDGEAGDSRLA
jgi:hypothetical protein